MKRITSILTTILISFPFSIWLLLILTESFIVRFHQAFALIVAIIPFVSVIIFGFYLLRILMKRSKKNVILFSLVLIICAFKYTNHWISSGATPSETAIDLKVMTWNLQRLGVLDNPKASTSNIEKLISNIDSNKTDVLILQEISKKQIEQLGQNLNLSPENYQWTSYYKGAYGGLAVLLLNNSSWTLINKQITNLPPSWKCIFTEMQHESGQTINVMGVHIAPPKVTDLHMEIAVKKLFHGDIAPFKEVLQRYVLQAKKQNKQIDKINKLVSSFKDPTIIAGDFNSTNQLPIHVTLRKSLSDAWLEGGNGAGATRYWAGVLPFRIDYIYTTHQFKVSNTYLGKADFSDHNPVISEVFIDPQN